MKRIHTAIIVATLAVLSACQGTPDGETSLPRSQEIPVELSSAALAEARYTLIDPSARRALTEEGQDFEVRVHGGSYESRGLTVSIDTTTVTYGDLTGDDVPEAVVRVTVGDGDLATTELAVMTATGGNANQLAAFPLGRATVLSTNVTGGAIRVSFMHTVPGDPGPRRSDLVLAMPNGRSDR